MLTKKEKAKIKSEVKDRNRIRALRIQDPDQFLSYARTKEEMARYQETAPHPDFPEVAKIFHDAARAYGKAAGALGTREQYAAAERAGRKAETCFSLAHRYGPQYNSSAKSEIEGIQGYITHVHNKRLNQQRGRLESTTTMAASIITLLGGIFFLSLNFSNSNISLSPGAGAFNWQLWLGIALILIGIVSGYFYFKKKAVVSVVKKKKK